jgi:hypothetical protein
LYGIPRLLPRTRCIECRLPREFAGSKAALDKDCIRDEVTLSQVWVGGILNYLLASLSRGTISDVANNRKVTED